MTKTKDQYKIEYMRLLESDTLLDYFPTFVGDWDKDGKYYVSSMVGKLKDEGLVIKRYIDEEE
jgi:hypothetical protein